MLSQLHRETILNNLRIILQSPAAVTQKEYMETYNAVFAHCTEHTTDYIIKGEPIYSLLTEKLAEFTDRLQFDGSIQHMTEQIRSFLLTIDLLEKVFSYLERFYIRVSILNNKDVKRIKDLFYHEVYYNFIYRAEESFVNVMLMEVETFRKQYKQDFSELAIAIQFYLNCLGNNGLTANAVNFCRLYIDEFQKNFEFDLDIGRLLKKIYIEMFFATTVISDRDIAKEIIQRILFRKDEILSYTLEKVEKFEKFKHIYAIINKMPENCRVEFKKRYEMFVTDFINKSHTFGDLYLNYCRVKEQVVLNKLVGFHDLVDECVRSSFNERSTAIQNEIHTEMVEFINNYIVNTYYMSDFYDKCSTSLELTQTTPGALEVVNEDDVNEKDEFQANAMRFFGLFALVFDDFLADLYTHSTQVRLLKGMSPRREQMFTDRICEKVGWSSVSILKKSVQNFQKITTHELGATEGESFTVTCVRITKSFWELEKDEPTLHPSLSARKEEITELIPMPEHHILEFNYSLSPVMFVLNGTKYKVNASATSLLLYIDDSPGITPEALRSVANDASFDSNLAILTTNGLVGAKVDDSGNQTLWVLDKQSCDNVVDLFDVPARKTKCLEFVLPDTHNQYVLEAQVCRAMKRMKETSLMELKNHLGCQSADFERVVSTLISKGYLNVEEDVIKYIP